VYENLEQWDLSAGCLVIRHRLPCPIMLVLELDKLFIQGMNRDGKAIKDDISA